MMFRDMVRDVCGACCAAAVLFGEVSAVGIMADNNTQDGISTLVTDRWSHLAPDGEVKTKINELLPRVLEERKEMEELVELVCKHGRPYGNYTHVRFADVVVDNGSEDYYRYGRMLATIANHQCGGGGAHYSVYWNDYEKGYYKYYPPAEDNEDDFISEKNDF
ncbi:MAG: hypothetical protein LBJ96_06405 [Holosporaceae bacterium]|jgi:hypothetical protein|nr:hypothetical protein [Holosporaceae bacterium]